MTDPTELDRVLAALDTWAGEYDPHTSTALDAARLLREISTDFDRVAQMAHTYGKTASVDHVRFVDVQWLDTARAKWRLE